MRRGKRRAGLTPSSFLRPVLECRDPSSIHLSVSMPPKLSQMCATPRAFFVNLPAHNQAHYINASGECVVCRHGVALHSHVVPEVVSVPVEAYSGAAYVSSSDPGQAFRETMAEIKEGPFCTDDSDVVKSSVSFLAASMHDGSSSFISEMFVLLGSCDISRRFVLRDDLRADVSSIQARSRDIKAVELIGIKFLEGLLKPTARHRHFVQCVELPVSRDPAGLSSEIKAIEAILSNRIVPRAGVVMPSARYWSSPDQCVYFGLWFATCPSSQLFASVLELVVAVGKAFKSEHQEAFWDKATHKYKYARLPPPPPSPSKRPYDGHLGVLPPQSKARRHFVSPYLKYTVEERRAHGLSLQLKREKVGAGDSQFSETAPPSTAASSAPSLPSTVALTSGHTFSPKPSPHQAWRSFSAGRGGGRDGYGRGRGGGGRN